MELVKVHYAKTHLSSLLQRVEHGEEICIARGDTAVAKLVPLSKPQRELGFGSYHMPDSFFDDLPEEELAAWEPQ